MKQPTEEELAAASSVVTIKFVPAKDGGPATSRAQRSWPRIPW